MDIKKTAMLAAVALPFFATAVFAAEPDPALSGFRTAYTSGDGISYVVIKDEKGEQHLSLWRCLAPDRQEGPARLHAVHLRLAARVPAAEARGQGGADEGARS